jgi:hypothetical protein
MNDILMKHCKYHIYADDVQLYISGKYDVIGDCVAILNESKPHSQEHEQRFTFKS